MLQMNTNTHTKGDESKGKTKKEYLKASKKCINKLVFIIVINVRVLTWYTPENPVSWLQIHFIKLHTCIFKGLITAQEIKLTCESKI